MCFYFSEYKNTVFNTENKKNNFAFLNTKM